MKAEIIFTHIAKTNKKKAFARSRPFYEETSRLREMLQGRILSQH
jgi:hypothetical protein